MTNVSVCSQSPFQHDAFGLKKKKPAPFVGSQEPNLDDLFKDPVLLALLKRDGINLSTLKEVIKTVQMRLVA